jgi:hypothetical protein
VVLTADPSLPLLICLPSTTIAAGLAGGYLGTVLTGGTAAAVLLLGRVLRSDDPAAAAYSASAAQWVLVAVLSGVLAARIHSLSAATSPMDRYAEARRLLSQLRAVTRGLEGSLDPGTVAQTLMTACNDVAHAEHGAVLLHVAGTSSSRSRCTATSASPGGPTSPTTARSRVPGSPAAPVVDRPPARHGRRGVRAGSTLLVLPIAVGDSRVGVVALEWRPRTATPRALLRRWSGVDRHALPLETAALFDELRIAAADRGAQPSPARCTTASRRTSLPGLPARPLHRCCSAGSTRGRAAGPPCAGQMTVAHQRPALSISDLRSSVGRRGPGRGAVGVRPLGGHELGHQGAT